MPLHPELRRLIQASSPGPAPDPSAPDVAAPDVAAPDLTVADKRRLHRNAVDRFAEVIDFGPATASEDHRVAVDGGEITVRLYRPDGAGPHPVHIFLHGGGFWRGSVDDVDFLCHWLVRDVGCAVASVDYRLAPEHRFPVPPQDCYTALTWIAANASALGIDPGRISIGGGSAGATLAAVTALMARDRGGPPLVAQVLEMPSTDLTLSHPSIDEFGSGYFLTKADLVEMVGYYLADPADTTNAYASPLFAANLVGLPPALVMTGEFDPLRDEGEAYAQRLRLAGVPVVLRRWDGHIHGSIILNRLLPDDAGAYRRLVSRTLRDAFGLAEPADAPDAPERVGVVP